MNIKAFYLHEHDNWATPSALYERIIARGYSDPCPLHSPFDSLKSDWESKCFVNPPYSKLRIWVEKCIEEAKKGKSILMLIPVRTDTKAFKMLYDYGCTFVFIHKRLRYNDDGCAPFPSMLVYLNGDQANYIWLKNEEDLFNDR